MKAAVAIAMMTFAAASVAAEIQFSNLIAEAGNGDAPTSVYLIRAESTWDEIWSLRHSSSDVPPKLPAVDFTRMAIIGFYAGGRPSSGYFVRITKVVENPDTITLEVEETMPASDCVALTVLTSPFVFVTVDAGIARKPLDFRLTVKRVSCGP